MTRSLLFFKANVSSYDFEGVMNSNNDFILNLKFLNLKKKKSKMCDDYDGDDYVR